MCSMGTEAATDCANERHRTGGQNCTGPCVWSHERDERDVYSQRKGVALKLIWEEGSRALIQLLASVLRIASYRISISI